MTCISTDTSHSVSVDDTDIEEDALLLSALSVYPQTAGGLPPGQVVPETGGAGVSPDDQDVPETSVSPQTDASTQGHLHPRLYNRTLKPIHFLNLSPNNKCLNHELKINH